MSDYQDPDLDINIDLNMDESKMDKAHKKLTAIESIWNKLSSLPAIDFDQKIRMGRMSMVTRNDNQKFGIFSADLESTLGGVVRESDAVKKLTYSWDSLYQQEINLLRNKEKQEKTLNLLASSVSDKMKSVPASSSGKYHPLFAQGEGGLIRHSKAVAQTAYGLAGLLNVPGDKDRFVVAGLMHDMWKLGPEGKSSFTDPKHGQLAADALMKAGLGMEASLAGPHMGNFMKGQYKNAPKISNFDQRVLNNADWLMSRTYAQDYVTWDKGNIQDINIKGLREEAVRRKDARLEKNGLLIPINEEQEKAAKSAKKIENAWHSTRTTLGQIIGLLKTIGALGLAALTIGIKETTAGSNQLMGGLGMFTGATDKQVLDNALRESKAGMSQGTINKAVAGLAAKRGQFKLTGAGDLLPLAMAGTIEGLMTGETPMQDVYGQVIDMFTKQLQGTKSQAQKDKLLALVTTNLGPEAAALVQAQARLGTNWEGLGARTSPAEGFLDWTKQVNEVNAQIQTSLNGIKDTWRGLFVEFTALFGAPFLGWIDTVFRKLGMDANSAMNNKKASETYLGMYNSLTPAQRRKMMEGSLLGQYDKKREAAESGFSKEMRAAENVTVSEINALLAQEGRKPYTALQLRSGMGTAEIKRIQLAKARAIAKKYGVDVSPSDNFYDIQRKVDEAGLAAVGGVSFGTEIPGYNSMPMATAENWFMFNTPANRKRFPKAIGMMEKFPSLMDTGRSASSFDSTMQGLMDALNTGVMTEEQVMPILESYFKSVESQNARDKDKVSMSGAQINMNFSLPDGSNPMAIKQGILDASREVPKIIGDAYQSLYAGSYG